MRFELLLSLALMISAGVLAEKSEYLREMADVANRTSEALLDVKTNFVMATLQMYLDCEIGNPQQKETVQHVINLFKARNGNISSREDSMAGRAVAHAFPQYLNADALLIVFKSCTKANYTQLLYDSEQTEKNILRNLWSGVRLKLAVYDENNSGYVGKYIRD